MERERLESLQRSPRSTQATAAARRGALQPAAVSSARVLPLHSSKTKVTHVQK